jgi:hypothetical protein
VQVHAAPDSCARGWGQSILVRCHSYAVVESDEKSRHRGELTALAPGTIVAHDQRNTALNAMQIYQQRLTTRGWPRRSGEANNHLVELAVAGQADYLVTRNARDLRGVGEHGTPLEKVSYIPPRLRAPGLSWTIGRSITTWTGPTPLSSWPSFTRHSKSFTPSWTRTAAWVGYPSLLV